MNSGRSPRKYMSRVVQVQSIHSNVLTVMGMTMAFASAASAKAFAVMWVSGRLPKDEGTKRMPPLKSPLIEISLD